MLISLAFRTWAFQPVQKTATIHVSSGFIWGIPAEVLMAAARLWNICRILGRERMKGHKEKPQEEIPEFISKLLSTDFRLRCGMGGLALLLPPLLIGWSLITGFDVLPNADLVCRRPLHVGILPDFLPRVFKGGEHFVEYFGCLRDGSRDCSHDARSEVLYN